MTPEKRSPSARPTEGPRTSMKEMSGHRSRYNGNMFDRWQRNRDRVHRCRCCCCGGHRRPVPWCLAEHLRPVAFAEAAELGLLDIDPVLTVQEWEVAA